MCVHMCVHAHTYPTLKSGLRETESWLYQRDETCCHFYFSVSAFLNFPQRKSTVLYRKLNDCRRAGEARTGGTRPLSIKCRCASLELGLSGQNTTDLASMRPWVPPPAPHRPGAMAQACHPSTCRQEDRKFKAVLATWRAGGQPGRSKNPSLDK